MVIKYIMFSNEHSLKYFSKWASLLEADLRNWNCVIGSKHVKCIQIDTVRYTRQITSRNTWFSSVLVTCNSNTLKTILINKDSKHKLWYMVNFRFKKAITNNVLLQVKVRSISDCVHGIVQCDRCAQHSHQHLNCSEKVALHRIHQNTVISICVPMSWLMI